MSNSESLRAAEAEILAAFQRFDVNRDGRISEAELVAILTRETSQRASLSPDEAKQLFAKADLDRAGHVARAIGGSSTATSGSLKSHSTLFRCSHSTLFRCSSCASCSWRMSL